MIHSGAVIAAGVSQGRSTTLGCDLKVTFGNVQCVSISYHILLQYYTRLLASFPGQPG